VKELLEFFPKNQEKIQSEKMYLMSRKKKLTLFPMVCII